MTNTTKTLFSTGFVNAYLGHIDTADKRRTFVQAGIYSSVTLTLTFITILVPFLFRVRRITTT